MAESSTEAVSLASVTEAATSLDVSRLTRLHKQDPTAFSLAVTSLQHGMTPLHHTIVNSHVNPTNAAATMMFLLKHDANIDTLVNHGRKYNTKSSSETKEAELKKYEQQNLDAAFLLIDHYSPAFNDVLMYLHQQDNQFFNRKRGDGHQKKGYNLFLYIVLRGQEELLTQFTTYADINATTDGSQNNALHLALSRIKRLQPENNLDSKRDLIEPYVHIIEIIMRVSPDLAKKPNKRGQTPVATAGTIILGDDILTRVLSNPQQYFAELQATTNPFEKLIQRRPSKQRGRRKFTSRWWIVAGFGLPAVITTVGFVAGVWYGGLEHTLAYIGKNLKWMIPTVGSGVLLPGFGSVISVEIMRHRQRVEAGTTDERAGLLDAATKETKTYGSSWSQFHKTGIAVNAPPPTPSRNRAADVSVSFDDPLDTAGHGSVNNDGNRFENTKK